MGWGTNPSFGFGVGFDLPVYNVSWNDICGGPTGADCTVSSFIGRLNAHLATTAFRLPTELQAWHDEKLLPKQLGGRDRG